jgi:hypothetical protein
VDEDEHLKLLEGGDARAVGAHRHAGGCELTLDLVDEVAGEDRRLLGRGLPSALGRGTLAARPCADLSAR